jgi:hypothetical protein
MGSRFVAMRSKSPQAAKSVIPEHPLSVTI